MKRLTDIPHAERYPFRAEAPTAIKPHTVPGVHASVVVRAGWRLWGFETEEARDTFVAQYHAIAK